MADNNQFPLRLAGYLVWMAALTFAFRRPLHALFSNSLQAEYTSQVVLMPLLAVYLIWSHRAQIFSAPRFSMLLGIAFAVCGLLIAAGSWQSGVDSAVLQLVSILMLTVAGFATFFGAAALGKAAFPFATLLLMLPVPSATIERVIDFLRAGSTALSLWMFDALGIPVLRNGFLLALPSVTIEVAKECSGINSSVALLITLLVVAHETLRSPWRKLVLLAVAVPLSIIKNAVRIVTLTILALKVNPNFLYGRLHHEGGFVFFLLTLGLLYPIWKLLQRGEAAAGKNCFPPDEAAPRSLAAHV